MTVNQYTNGIVRKIKCGGAKKKDIKKQLMTDINLRIEQGEKLEDIIAHMGCAKEIAEGFNESISPKEEKKYVRNKILKILLTIILLLSFLICFIYWLSPKVKDLDNSKYFNKNQVESAMLDTIELLDEENYASLQGKAISQMQSILNKETMQDVRNQISDNWGKRQSFGVMYTGELLQGNTHYAIGEITVIYENVSVTYRLTFDKNMQLAGLFIR